MQKLISPLLIIVIAALLRLVPHPSNVSPIAAIALFGGAYLDKRYAFIVPVFALFFSDLFLGFYSVMPFVYGSFLLTGCIGLWLKNNKRISTLIAASLFSSVLFYLLTNFGVWLMGSMYPKTFAGLISCYSFALPFFRNTLFGDLIYTGLFFGGYMLVINLNAYHSKVKVTV